VRNAVVAVFGVSPEVAIQPISKMNEFLADNDFDRARASQIDSLQIDQDEVTVVALVVGVGAAIRGGHSPAEPGFVLRPARGHTARDVANV
jgi:hypothetical protein